MSIKLLALLLAASLWLVAQPAEQTVASGYIRKSSLSVMNGSVAINLPPGPWLAGVRDSGEKPPNIAVAVASKSAITDWSLRGLLTAGGSVNISSPDTPAGTVVMLLLVPAGTSVTFHQEGGATIQTSRSGVLVRNGQVQNESTVTLGHLLNLARYGELPPTQPMTLMKNGHVHVNLATFKTHILSASVPGRPDAPLQQASGSTCKACGRSALIQIEVSETGRVVKATALSAYAGTQLSNAAVTAASEWRFTPFSYNGMPVIADAIVAFYLDQQGAVHSSIFE